MGIQVPAKGEDAHFAFTQRQRLGDVTDDLMGFIVCEHGIQIRRAKVPVQLLRRRGLFANAFAIQVQIFEDIGAGKLFVIAARSLRAPPGASEINVAIQNWISGSLS